MLHHSYLFIFLSPLLNGEQFEGMVYARALLLFIFMSLLFRSEPGTWYLFLKCLLNDGMSGCMGGFVNDLFSFLLHTLSWTEVFKSL